MELEGWEKSDGGHQLVGTRETIKQSDGTAGRRHDTRDNMLLWQCHIVYNKSNRIDEINRLNVLFCVVVKAINVVILISLNIVLQTETGC